jgi:hypothetical protein
MTNRLLNDGSAWGPEQITKLNHLLGTSLPADLSAAIAAHNADAAANTAAITALKAASNTWSNTNNFTGTVQIAGVGLLAGLRGHIAGLTLSNNGSDATNDIDIAVGAATAGDQSALLVLSSALTKQLDAAWAVGTNQGGLDTGSIANTTYHVWLIRRPDTGVVDALFSTSATAPTMPTNYTQKRRIGSIRRVAGAIGPFSQVGDRFSRVPTRDVNANNPGTSAVTASLSVPSGIIVTAMLNLLLEDTTLTAATYLLVTPLALADSAPSAASFTLGYLNTSGVAWATGNVLVDTNTSAQVRYRLDQSTADHFVVIATSGWIDRRGQDD